MLNRYQRLAYRLFGSGLAKKAQGDVHLRLSLQKAHIFLRPEVYLAYSYLNMLLAFGLSLFIVLVATFLHILDVVAIPTSMFVFLIPVPLVLAFMIYLLTFLIPDLRASTRARDIDTKLPYALNYISTMAAAGVAPEKIFANLSQQTTYGEVANEAAWISRDLSLLGKDLLSALSAAIDRSPSIRFQDFLQGAISALSSGEDIKRYFLAKSEQFVLDNRQDQKRFLDNLGVLAEAYVTVVVAAPLLLIILLSVMIFMGGDPDSMLTLGYTVILLLLPMVQFAFAATLRFVTPEA